MRRAAKDIKRRACMESAQVPSLSAAKHSLKKPEPTKLHQAIPSPAHMRVPALRSLFQTTADPLPVKPRPEHACSRLSLLKCHPSLAYSLQCHLPVNATTASLALL